MLAVGLLSALPRYHSPGELVGLAVALLLLAVLPLAFAWHLFRRHVYVDPEGVTVVVGTRQRRIAYADLDWILPRSDQVSVKVLDTRNMALILEATSPAGRRTRVQLSAQDLETIDPVLLALEEEVARRPELLRTDYARRDFEWSLAAARQRVSAA